MTDLPRARILAGVDRGLGPATDAHEPTTESHKATRMSKRTRQGNAHAKPDGQAGGPREGRVPAVSPEQGSSAGVEETAQASRGNTRKARGGGRGTKARGSLDQAQGVLPLATDTRNPSPILPQTGPSAGLPHTPISAGPSPEQDYIPADDGSDLDDDDFPALRDEQQDGTGARPRTKLYQVRQHSLKNVGRDREGKVIPHFRSDAVAQRVAVLVAGGMDEYDIACVLNIRPGLVRRHYGAELASGKAIANSQVVSAIHMQAAAGEPQMAKFWAKARMGWRDGDSSKGGDDSALNIHIHLE